MKDKTRHNKLRISIITACYNSASTLEKALKSVSEQTYSNIEYIVVDGASSDNTSVLLEKYKFRINKLISEPDKGIYDALNKGVAQATGDYIGFLHADDFYAHSKVIEKVAFWCQQSKADAIYGDLQYVSRQQPDRVIRKWKSGKFNLRKLKMGWMPPHPALFLKRELYLKNGMFDISFRIAADYDLIIRNFKNDLIKIYYFPELLYIMRVGGESNKSIGNILDKSKEDLKALRKNKFGGVYTVFFKNFRKIGQFF